MDGSRKVGIMIKLELTRDEARMLEMFLLMTTRYREDQVKMYRKLLDDCKGRGGISEITLQAYVDNAQHWTEQCVAMDGIRKMVSEQLTTPNDRQ